MAVHDEEADVDPSAEPSVALVARLTAAIGLEIERTDPRAAIAWPTLPDVESLVGHVGVVHRWVTQILRTRGPADEDPRPARFEPDLRGWYEHGRRSLLAALLASPADTPCWIIGDRMGTTAFWRRRMVYENVKHLIDLRASGGRPWRVAAELTPVDYADGVDELFGEFLWRSRPNLQPLPAPLSLHATDTGQVWRISPSWAVSTTPATPGRGEPGADVNADAGAADVREAGISTRVHAPAGELALAVWERADPLGDTECFQIEGDRAVVAAFRAAPIHPW